MGAKKITLYGLALPLLAACGGGGGGPGTGTGVQQVPTAAEAFVSLAAGSDHTCAISSHGRTFCWGANRLGQLGNGATEGSATPVLVPQTVRTFTSVVAGREHTCATDEIAFYCWGDNAMGQLGDGTFQPSSTPVLVQRRFDMVGASFLGIASGPGADHSCAASDREIICWGSNRFGQLATAVVPYAAIPASVAKPGDAYPYAGWNYIAAGASHSCAQLEDGNAWCWGDNASGQLGRANVPTSPAPIRIQGFLFAQLAAGGAHTCGVTRSSSIAIGQTACWGSNSFGQLGNGTTTDSADPVFIPTPVFQFVVAGTSHTCGITQGAELFCWGSNLHGQLGIGGNTSSPVPRLVRLSPVADAHFVSVVLGREHTCAISDSHKTYCWGSNASGQLGTGNFVDSDIPVPIAANLS